MGEETEVENEPVDLLRRPGKPDDIDSGLELTGILCGGEETKALWAEKASVAGTRRQVPCHEAAEQGVGVVAGGCMGWASAGLGGSTLCALHPTPE